MPQKNENGDYSSRILNCRRFLAIVFLMILIFYSFTPFPVTFPKLVVRFCTKWHYRLLHNYYFSYLSALSCFVVCLREAGLGQRPLCFFCGFIYLFSLLHWWRNFFYIPQTIVCFWLNFFVPLLRWFFYIYLLLSTEGFELESV